MSTPNSSPQSSKNRPSRSLLRRADQTAVATITLVAMFVLGAYQWRQWSGSRGVIDIEHAAPLVATFQVNVNAAEWPEVAQIPDLGETLARRLVEERKTHGPYEAFADLRRRVKGIGPKTLEKIAPYLQPISTGVLAAQSPTQNVGQ
jgi:competence protein ComEA